MRLLLLVLILSIFVNDTADAYSFCQTSPINFVSELEDDDEDKSCLHHRPHYECQHDNSTDKVPPGGLPHKPHQHRCCHHHGPSWLSISSRNLSALNFQHLQMFPEEKYFLADDVVEPPYRPPQSSCLLITATNYTL